MCDGKAGTMLRHLFGGSGFNCDKRRIQWPIKWSSNGRREGRIKKKSIQLYLWRLKIIFFYVVTSIKKSSAVVTPSVKPPPPLHQISLRKKPRLECQTRNGYNKRAKNRLCLEHCSNLTIPSVFYLFCISLFILILHFLLFTVLLFWTVFEISQIN